MYSDHSKDELKEDGWLVQIAFISMEFRMVCSGNFYNSELSTAAAAGQVEVLSPGSSAATAPTESCRRGAGVAGVALALPSLPGTT